MTREELWSLFCRYAKTKDKFQNRYDKILGHCMPEQYRSCFQNWKRTCNMDEAIFFGFIKYVESSKYRLAKEKFEGFLKEKKCFKAYFRALTEQTRKYHSMCYQSLTTAKERFIYKCHAHNSLCGIIDKSFCWAETTEGDSFWRELDNEWNERYNALFGSAGIFEGI